MSTTADPALTYRVAGPDDVSGVLALWGAQSGWGEFALDEWEGYYVDRPHGPSLVTVGVDPAGAIASIFVFNPRRVLVEGRELDALHMAAPVVRSDYRRIPLGDFPTHPIGGMYFAMLPEASARGFSVLYAVPDRSWVPLFRWAPSRYSNFPLFQAAEPQCVALEVARARTAPYIAAPGGAPDAEYDELWDEAVEAWGLACAVVRRAPSIAHLRRYFMSFDVRDRSGALAGHCAVRERDSLVIDVLVRRPDEAADVLSAVARALPAELTELKVMAVGPLEPALAAAGFRPIDYRFGFLAQPIDDSVPLDALAYERWWVGPLG